jgi:hypothetical protein
MPELTKDQERLSKTSKYTGELIDVRLTGRYKRDGVTHEAGETIKMHSDELDEKPWLCEVGMERERAYQEFTETIGLKGPGRRIDAPVRL